MPAHGLKGGLQASAAASPLFCFVDRLDTQEEEETSRVLAFLLFAYRFLFSFSGIGSGWVEKGEGFWSFLYGFGRFVFCCYSVVGREMEEKKSSFVDEFFPEKEAALPPKSDILSSIFPPRSPVAVKGSFNYELSAAGRASKQGNEDQSLTEQMGASGGSFHASPGKNQDGHGLKKSNDPNVPCEIAEPCLMSSSVYYGGRDDFIPEISSSYKSESINNYTKDSEDASNSDAANRGEWWQGSFYY